MNKKILLLIAIASISQCLFAINLNINEYEKQLAILDSRADSLMEAEDYPSLYKVAEKMIALQQEYNVPDSVQHVQLLQFVGDGYLETGELDLSLKYNTQALEIYKALMGEESLEYASCLYSIAYAKFYKGDIAQSLEMNERVYDIRKKLLPENDKLIGESLYMMATNYLYSGKDAKALDLVMRVKDIFKVDPGEDSYEYGALLNFIGTLAHKQARYQEAIAVGEESLSLLQKTNGDNDPNTLKAMSSLSMSYHLAGDTPKAIQLANMALEIQRKTLGDKHPDCGITLDHLSQYYKSRSELLKAKRCAEEEIDIIEYNFGKGHTSLYSPMANLASVYNALSDYDKAIELQTEALELAEQQYGKETATIAIELNNLATYYGEKGDYRKSIELSNESLNIMRKVKGTDNDDYATTLHNMARYYCYLGNNNSALDLVSEALDITKRICGDVHPKIALMLDNKAKITYEMGDISNAISLTEDALDMIRQIYGDNHAETAYTLNNLGAYNYYAGDYLKAVECYNASKEICEKSYGTNSALYENLLNNLSSIYMALNLNDEACILSENAYNIANQLYGKGSIRSISKLANIVLSNFQNAKQKKLDNSDESQLYTERTEDYADQLVNTVSAIVKGTFTFLTSNERSLFWEKNKTIFFNYIPNITEEFMSDRIASTAYNASLIGKGLLLNTDIEFRKLLKAKGDQASMDMFMEMSDIMREIENQNALSPEKRTIDVDSLRTVAQGLEKTLISRSQQYGDYTNALEIDWKKVQQNLHKDEVAVEFIVSEHSDSIPATYMALILTADAAPRVIPLLTNRSLDSAQDIYNSPTLASLIWKPIEDIVGDKVKSIYFSPTSEFHNIAIESLPDWKTDGFVNDRINLYRMSSTRELALNKHNTSKLEKSALFGGLEYDTDPSILTTDSDRYRNSFENRNNEAYISTRDIVADRGRVSYLPGSLAEVEYLSKNLKKAGLQHKLFTGDEGTESAFKMMDGDKTSLLHIATHGFYWKEKEAKMHRNLGFLNQLEDKAPVEDKAMTRSGLLFAGANNVFKGWKPDLGVDDGILTAKEISLMDLNHVNLVVLSACQTGLGEINSEGVFGLQRGFKKAGVNSIMMSLWKVDDEATQYLMQTFYDNLLAGETKYMALKKAQSSLRNSEGGRFKDPKYWASFIILDCKE